MRKYHNFAVGWLRENDKGQFISAVANGERQKCKLLVELEDGTVVRPEKFFVNLSSDKPSEKAPDASFTFVTE